MSENPYSAPTSRNLPPDGGIPEAGRSLPGLALTIAIIGIVLGAVNFFGSCCGVAGLAGFSAMANNSAFQGALQDASKDDPEAMAEFDKAREKISENMVGIIFQMGLGLILGAMLLGGSIGTLMRKEWGRKLLVMGCLAGIAFAIISFAISFATGNLGGNFEDIPADQRAMALGSVIVGYVFAIASLAYYIWGWRYLAADERRGYFS